MRADLLVKEKLGISRQKAAQLIKDGNVLLNGRKIKPALDIVDEDALFINSENDILKYVSRGGLKLEGAIEKFSVDVKDRNCLDIGASTGGFTDCLLKHGAKTVTAVDVGREQLCLSLREDKRVLVYEDTDIRGFKVAGKELYDVIVCDASFISLKLILSEIQRLLKAEGFAILLVKPQFEVGRENIGKNGIVKDKRAHIRALEEITAEMAACSLYPEKLTFSPITGGDGNIEYFIKCVKTELCGKTDITAAVKAAFSQLKRK